MMQEFLSWLLDIYKLLGVAALAAVVFLTLLIGPIVLVALTNKYRWMLLYLITFPILIGIAQFISF